MLALKELFLLMGLCTTLVHGMSEEMQDLINSLHAQCSEDTGATEETIVKAQKGEFEDDEKLKCYMKCLFDELGLIDDNGKLDVDGAVAMLPDEVRDPFGPTIRKCAAKGRHNTECPKII